MRPPSGKNVPVVAYKTTIFRSDKNRRNHKIINSGIEVQPLFLRRPSVENIVLPPIASATPRCEQDLEVQSVSGETAQEEQQQGNILVLSYAPVI